MLVSFIVPHSILSDVNIAFPRCSRDVVHVLSTVCDTCGAAVCARLSRGCEGGDKRML